MICEHLGRFSAFLDAHAIMAFAPLTGEVELADAMRTAQARHSRVCLPRMNWVARTMAPARIEHWGEGLEVRRHDLPEPTADAPIEPLAPGDLVLVPGLAFDSAGGRLGRGAGFYDRFLADLPRGVTACGVGLACQIVSAVPMEVHDRRLDAMLCESGLVWHEPS